MFIFFRLHIQILCVRRQSHHSPQISRASPMVLSLRFFLLCGFCTPIFTCWKWHSHCWATGSNETLKFDTDCNFTRRSAQAPFAVGALNCESSNAGNVSALFAAVGASAASAGAITMLSFSMATPTGISKINLNFHLSQIKSSTNNIYNNNLLSRTKSFV